MTSSSRYQTVDQERQDRGRSRRALWIAAAVLLVLGTLTALVLISGGHTPRFDH